MTCSRLDFDMARAARNGSLDASRMRKATVQTAHDLAEAIYYGNDMYTRATRKAYVTGFCMELACK